MRPAWARGFRAWVAGAAALAVCACRAGPQAGSRTLTVALRGDVTGFYPNPPITNEAYTFQINNIVLEGLVRYNGTFGLEPALASSWSNPDERTYLFTLRPGVKFSDGRPVTAADVVASLLAPRERGWATRDYLQAIESVRAVDESRVEVRTRAADLVLLTRLPWVFILPAADLARKEVPVVGTGAYRLASWSPGHEITLSRNPHYRGPAASFESVRLLVEPQDQARVKLVLEGKADLADQVPLETVEALTSRADVRVVARASLRVLFLALRCDVPPFSDPRLRQVVDLALDRDELVHRVFGGHAQVASQIVPPAVIGHNSALPSPFPDRTAARDLLKAAGKIGLQVRLDGPNNRYVKDQEVLFEVARQLAEVGLRVEVQALDKRDFFRLVDRGQSAFHLVGWASDAGDAGDALDQLAHSPVSAGSLGSYNSVGLSDATLDALIDEANRSATQGTRTRRLQAALARLAELRVLLPLVVPEDAFLLSRRIRWDPPLTFALRPEEMALSETAR